MAKVKWTKVTERYLWLKNLSLNIVAENTFPPARNPAEILPNPRVETANPKVERGTPRVQPKNPRVKPMNPRVERATPQVEAANTRVQATTPRVDATHPRVGPLNPRVEPVNPKVEATHPKGEPLNPGVQVLRINDLRLMVHYMTGRECAKDSLELGENLRLQVGREGERHSSCSRCGHRS